MRRALLLFALLVPAGCAAPGAGSGAAPTDRAPDFTLTSLDGTTVRGASLWQERPALLVFMTAWCASCREEVPRLNELARRHTVVAIDTGDSRAKVERMRAETGIACPVLLDAGAVAGSYGIQSTPTCVLVGTDGTIRHRGSKPPDRME
jgi:peroxiredoxin